MSLPMPIQSETAWETVHSYEHKNLLLRIMRKCEVSESQAEELFTDLKRFLFVCGQQGRSSFVPTRSIDKAWHEFLMYTKDYDEFCAKYFGRKVHHNPNELKAVADHLAIARTLKAARDAFGDSALKGNWIYTDVNGTPLTEIQLLNPSADDCPCHDGCDT